MTRESFESRLTARCVEIGFSSIQEALEAMYVQQNQSAMTISLKLDCSPNAIYKLLRQQGIEVRPTRSGKKVWSRDMRKHFK